MTNVVMQVALYNYFLFIILSINFFILITNLLIKASGYHIKCHLPYFTPTLTV